MIISSIEKIKSQPFFFECKNFIKNNNIYLKLEGLNIAGSIKFKAALHIMNELEKNHHIDPKQHKIIESSSGNLGVALSIICKEKGYQFCCVTDPNISPANERSLRIYGAEIVKIHHRDAAGGYLSSRIEYIKKLISTDNSYIWTNQYASEYNISAHYNETAKEIFANFPSIDYLFIGAGTTGTLMGCAKYFKKHSPKTQLIAVDSVGSITFGFPPSKRHIPGIGTSRCPEILDGSLVDKVIMVPEKNAITMCHDLLNQYTLFLGGSSGSVMSAIKSYDFDKDKIPNATIVAISPDFGHSYLDTIYNPDWVKSKFDLTEG